MDAHTTEPSSTFSALRQYLFANQPIRHFGLELPCNDGELRAIRELIKLGSLEEARRKLAVLRVPIADRASYWWTSAYAALESGHAEDARGCLHELLLLASDDSRSTLNIWQRLRDVGEAPPDDRGARVLGVVVESASRPPEQTTIVAGYADGQIRWLNDPGPCLIGERWSTGEQALARALVDHGQAALAGFDSASNQEPLDSGFVRVHLLTPGGPHSMDVNLHGLDQHEGPLNELVGTALQLHRAASWLVGMTTQNHTLSAEQKAQALMDVVSRGDAERAEAYLRLGADCNSTVEQRPVLTIAVSQGNLEMARLLIGRGADVNATVTNEDGLLRCPALSLAAAKHSSALLEILLAAGAVIDAADGGGVTALMTAAYLGRDENVRLLLDRGSDLEKRDASGYSALMYACNAGHLRCAKVLVEGGAEVNARDGEGNAPLAFAAQKGHAAIVDLLLQAGSAPHLTGSQGLCAADLAEQNQHLDLARQLRALSAREPKSSWWTRAFRRR